MLMIAEDMARIMFHDAADADRVHKGYEPDLPDDAIVLRRARGRGAATARARARRGRGARK